MSTCARCGKEFGFFSTKFNSETVYDTEFNYNSTLNAKLPNNPYRGKHLCAKCYREVYESSPTSEKSLGQFAPPPPPSTQPTNNSLNYLLFAFGAVMLIVGIYLSTYTTVIMVNLPYNIAGTTINIPHPEQVQPYLAIGIIAIVFALVLIAIAFITFKKASNAEPLHNSEGQFVLT